MDRVLPPEPAVVQRGFPSSAPDALDQLRQILFGHEKRTLSGLQQRHDDPILHAEDISRVLPQAVIRCVRQDDRLAHAMAPAIESALKSSVRRDPGILTNAIFPIIGPAIRKALAESFGRLVQSFNHALEHSLSWRSLKWRMEAWRTGRPFAEVVLYHTLVFRVEQVFLIHQHTGLLLQHVVAPEVRSSNEDVISGMLTAIQSFARDAFRVGPGEELQTIRVGELDVWVETGPHAALAFVIRGQAPEAFRQTLVDALEAIHRDEALALGSFKGEATLFQLVRPQLEECLKTQFTDQGRGAMSPKMLFLLGAVVLAGVGWGVVRWQDSARRDGFFAALRQEPGFVITETAGARGKWRVTGLKDPLARDPVELATRVGLNAAKLEFHWQPYVALNSEFLLRRARARLTPPPGVDMEVRAGALVLSGIAPENWWREAQSVGLRLPGIDRVDGTGLRLEMANSEGPSRDRTQVLKDELKNSVLYFSHAQAALTNQMAAIATVARAARELAQLARAENARFTLLITGHADRTGSEDVNLALSRQRSESVRQRLIETGVPREMLATVGAGSRAPTQAGLAWSRSRSGSARDVFCALAALARVRASMTQLKICTLGAYAVGKTSLIARFARGIFSEQYLATLGVKIDSKELDVAGQRVKLIIWDMEGEEEFAKVGVSYLRGAAGYILVADGTRRSTMDQAAVLQVRVTEARGPIPFIALINKSDVESDWEVSESDLDKVRATKWDILKTSAKTGEGVETAFARLAQRVLEESAR